MADLDSEPLLDDLGDDAPGHTPSVDFSKMVFFYGKEMKTTPNPAIFRMGVNKEGVFKLDSEENKVLAHWKYSDITDWTFSGYSFSLTTRGNKHHYIRTDDGDSLCKYIEAFIKNPEHAMEMAALNPPMSKFPDSAVRSLSRKFSNHERGSSPPSNDGPKFYTLTRKPAQRSHMDGVPRSVQHMHVDVDSRLNPPPRGAQRRSITEPPLRGASGGAEGSSNKNRDALDPLQLHPLLSLSSSTSLSSSPFREKSLSISEGNPARRSNGFTSQEQEGSLLQSHSSETPRPRSNVLLTSSSPSSSYVQCGGSGEGKGGSKLEQLSGTVAPPPCAADKFPDLITLTSPPPIDTAKVRQLQEGAEEGRSHVRSSTVISSPIRDPPPTPAAVVGMVRTKSEEGAEEGRSHVRSSAVISSPICDPPPAPAAVVGVVRTKQDGSRSAAKLLWSRRVSEGKDGREGPSQDTCTPTPTTITIAGDTPTGGPKQPDSTTRVKSSALAHPSPPLLLLKDDPSPSLGPNSNECSLCSDSEHGSPFRRSGPPGGEEGGVVTSDLLHVTTTKYAMNRESEDTEYDKLMGCFATSGTHAPTTTTHLKDDQTSSESGDSSHRLTSSLKRESPLHHHHHPLQLSPQRRPNVYEEVTMPPSSAGDKKGGGGGRVGTTKVGTFHRHGSHTPSDEDNYDHLPGSREGSPTPPSSTTISPPPSLSSYAVLSSIGDRSISQPLLNVSKFPLSPQTSGGGGSLTGGKPSGLLVSLDESSIGWGGGGDGGCGSETNLSEQRSLSSGGVVLRSKPKPPAPSSTSSLASRGEGEGEEPDPFEEIMTRPTAASRLRWSQELNPLYDYFKGAKFTQKMASLDYVLYENPQEDHITPTTSTSSVTPTSSTSSPLIQTEEGEEGGGGREPSFVPYGGTLAGNDLLEEECEGDETSLVSQQMTDSGMLLSLERAGEVGDAVLSFSEATPQSTLPRPPRRSHMYEDVSVTGSGAKGDGRPRSYVSGTRHQSDVVSSSSSSHQQDKADQVTLRYPEANPLAGGVVGGGGGGPTPIASVHIGKRQIMLNQRRSRTLGSLDDLAATRRKQKPIKAADNMKDFSYVMREFRVFYIQMPNGNLHSDVINITRPVSEVIEKLCCYLGVDDPDVYVLYLTGSCLTSLKETGVDTGDDAAIHFKANRKGSFTHLVDHQVLPDQGNEPILLKSNLSLKMQGITTSRILLLQCEQDVECPVLNIVLSPEDEFNKCWLSIVQGNTPCSVEQAVKLAAIQYQAYVQHRTAMNSTVAFCRPIDFLPVEYAGVRGIDQKMYKEQESLNLKSEKDIYTTYRTCYASLPTHDTIFFPAREPRRKLLHSTKLKPILIGVNSKGVLRVDHKTKEVLDMWEYQVLKNWAYSKRTFVLAFANKNYPMESIQARWISTLVDFHVDSILDSAANLGKLITDNDQ